MKRTLFAFAMLVGWTPILFAQSGVAVNYCLVNGNSKVTALGCRVCILTSASVVCDKDENYRSTGQTPTAPSNAVVTGVYLNYIPVASNLDGYSLDLTHAGRKDRLAVDLNGSLVLARPQTPLRTFNGQYVEADGGNWQTSVVPSMDNLSEGWTLTYSYTVAWDTGAAPTPNEPAIGNPGFDGTTSPWSVYSPQSGFSASITTTIGHSGDSCLREEGGTADGVVFQDIFGLTPGRSYRISAWVIPQYATADAVLSAHDATGANYVQAVPLSRQQESGFYLWQQVSLIYTANNTGKVRIHLIHKPRVGPIFWDEVGIAELMGSQPAASAVSLIANHSGKCLDVTNAGTQNGAKLQQWECNGSAQQKFWLSPAAGGSYAIIGFAGKVLDVTGQSMANTAPIEQWDYWVGSHQQWYLVQAGNNLYKVQSHLSGKVLDVTSASTADGAPIQQYDYLQGSNQQWLIVKNPDPAPAGIYNIVAEHSGKCLDVYNAQVEDGARIQQWDCNGSPQQQFQIAPVSPGIYKIVVFTGKTLDVTNSSPANGAPIQQFTYLNGNNQQWLLVPAGGGEYKIQSLRSWKVLDVTGGPGATGNGVLLQQWDDLKGANQRFFLRPVK